MDQPTPSSLVPVSLPTELQRLNDLAHNVWWSWTPVARELFEQFDQTLWRLTQHNPVKQLQLVTPDRLAALSQDVLFLRQYQAAVKAHDDYMASTEHWYGLHHPQLRQRAIAIFLQNSVFIVLFHCIAVGWACWRVII